MRYALLILAAYGLAALWFLGSVRLAACDDALARRRAAILTFVERSPTEVDEYGDVRVLLLDADANVGEFCPGVRYTDRFP